MKRAFATRIVLLAIVLSPAWAPGSILTFDLLDKTNDQRLIPQTYGDNIASAASDGVASSYDVSNGTTPDIGLSYSAQHASIATPTTGFRYYNDAVWPEAAWLFTLGADNATLTNRIFDITFTPSNGAGVLVNSFRLIDYTNFVNGANHTVNWSIIGDGITTLLSGSKTVASKTTATFEDVSTGMTSAYFGVVTLRLQHAAGSRDDLALDNVNFQQVAVPEPASVGVLIACGAGAIGITRRRR